MRLAGVGRSQTDTGSNVVTDYRVPDEEVGVAGGTRVLNTLLRDLCDYRVLDGDRGRGEDPDADGARHSSTTLDAVDLQSPDVDLGAGGGGVDGDAGNAGGEDRPKGPNTVDGHRLGDGHGAHAARIEAVDFAGGGGLGNRAGKGLAGRGSAAGIDVVTDAGNPSAGRLSAGRSRGQQRH